MWLEFGTDGYLYTTSRTTANSLNTSIIRFNSTTGTLVDSLAIGRDSWSFMVGPNNIIYYSGNGGANYIERYGSSSIAAFKVSLSEPSTSSVTVNYTTQDGTAIGGVEYVSTSGSVTFAPGQTSQTILVRTLDDLITEQTETFNVILSNTVGASFANNATTINGVASILDNDPFTKFYVVNDASTDRTYEYGEKGASVENYALAGGNTAPRGAASIAAGTKVWVVDANKSVYTYDTSGVLQGSWAAGGLQATAQLEGIATNGTDVWLVDRTADKVYRYTNAASLTGGGQNAFSSFSLNSGNTNPKDIVTDGNYLWVVEDSSTDKVFKYTVAGTFVGSWRISTSGAKNPTGITLDPSNPAHIWIVDSGTDRVYQYDNSVGLTSGSKSANSSWALAAGNTNPQGIADPPPPGAMLPNSNAIGLNSEVIASTPVPLSGVGGVAMPWFSAAAASVPSARSQEVKTNVRSTDDFMSVLGLASEQPKTSVRVTRTQTVVPDKSFDLSELDEDKIKDSDMESLIGLVAHDLWR